MKVLLILAAIVAACRSESLSMPVDPDLFPVSFIGDGPNAGSTVCIDAALNHCQSSFNAYLNITGVADWSSPGILAHALNTYFLSGVPGLLQVCNARTLFYQCLGSSYSSCINRLYFIEKGYSQQASYGYVQIMKELEFTCGGGLMQAVQSWGCILNVVNNYQSTFNGCVSNFNNTITQNPNALCQAAQDLTNCFRFPYIVTCGGAVGWWACERVRIAFELGTQCQSLQCNINSRSAKDEEEKELPENSEKKPVHPMDIHALPIPESLFEEYQRMANKIPISDEEMKLAGGHQ